MNIFLIKTLHSGRACPGAKNCRVIASIITILLLYRIMKYGRLDKEPGEEGRHIS